MFDYDDDVPAGCLVVLSLPVTLLTKAFAFQHLWNWFVARLGAQSLNLFEAMGIVLTISLAVGSKEVSKESGNEGPIVAAYKYPVAYLIVLFVGWIIHKNL